VNWSLPGTILGLRIAIRKNATMMTTDSTSSTIGLVIPPTIAGGKKSRTPGGTNVESANTVIMGGSPLVQAVHPT
jgi:hypothetical protein